VLLEWGHSMYYNNKGELLKGSDNDSSLVTDFLLQKNLHPTSIDSGVSITMDNYVDFLKLIKYQRIASFGNYDAMFGKVCNFHWSFLPDGSYDITIDLVSIGDIVESFKINALISGIDKSIKVDGKEKDPSQMTSVDVITDYVNKSEIGKYFYSLIGGKNNELLSGTVSKPWNSSGINIQLKLLRDSLGVAQLQKDNEKIKIIEAKINELLALDTSSTLNKNTSSKDTLSINYDGTIKDTIYYIRLGAFLNFIQQKLIYSFDVKNGNPTKAVHFDTDIESNLMYVEPLQVSVDPTVCVIRRDVLIKGGLWKFGIDNNGEGGESFESPLFSNLPGNPVYNNPYGQIMNTYVSMKFILLKLDELKDKNTNKVPLIDFLNNILSSINSSLGGINKLEASVDETTNTVIIIDGNPLPNKDKVIEVLNNKNKNLNIYDKYATFDLYGYSGSSAGFVKDFNFTTEISPGLSTILTVGSTANSTVVGENSTAFSKFNRGCTDRFKEKIIYTDENGNPDNVVIAYAPPQYSTPEARKNTQDLEDQKRLYEELYLKYTSTYNSYCEYIIKLSRKIYNGEADTYKDALNNFITFKQQADYAKWVFMVKEGTITEDVLDELTGQNGKFTPSTGFIPFNMSLTMDGLSGMKIYSKFNIDTRYLPANYPSTADFLIKNIEHTIENNKWFTKLDSVVISQKGK
jgi:hypothetical protein